MPDRNAPRFIVDFMLGRLSRWLRLLGYDTVYAEEADAAGLIMRSLREDRIIVTRDTGLSRKRALRSVLIEHDGVPDQLRQVFAELRLRPSPELLYTRCSACNGSVETVSDKETVREEVPAYVFDSRDDFSRCAACGKVYWMGTHAALLLKDLKRAGIRLPESPRPRLSPP